MHAQIIPTCTTCPYCGVGCGVVVKAEPDQTPVVEGDISHPANFGKLCAKGLTLGETLGQEDRLLHPMIAGRRASWDDALNQIAISFGKTIRDYGPDAVAFYVSGQCLTEDYYVANKLMKGYIGSANIDTNSRLCMASSVAGHKRAFGADIVPGCYEDLEVADLLILTGSNLAWCHPVLYQRIIAAKTKRPEMKIIVIDPRETASCDQADLHLALAPGSDVTLFQGLLNYLDSFQHRDEEFIQNHTENLNLALLSAASYSIEKVAKITKINPEDIQLFYQYFAQTPRTVTVYSQGVNQAQNGTDRVNSVLNCHLLTGRVGKIGSTPFSVTGQPNAMGGREVGGLANQLASHMEIANPEHRDLVQRFWQSPHMAAQPGLKAVDLFRAMHAGDVKAIWIMATNPVDSLPDADFVREALKQCDLVVVSDIYGHTDTVACADIVLPSTGWGEKDGMVTNSERRLSRQRAFMPPPGESRHDWWQLCEVAKRMGFAKDFDFAGPADIFKEYARLCSFENDGRRDLDLSALTDLSDIEYDQFSPVQWPVTHRYPDGLKRFFQNGRFFTPSGKAQFIAPQEQAEGLDNPDYPFTLNTGRMRDQWHTMTRTGRAVRLSNHISEPFIEIHPSDAKGLNLQDADIAQISSQYGQMLARVSLTRRQRPGAIFAPMHFTDQFASKGRVDALIAPKLDPISGQPAFKASSVSVAKFPASWYGFAVLASDQFSDITLDAQIAYWAKMRIPSGVRIELAGQEIYQDWQGFFENLLGVASKNTEILQLRLFSEKAIRLAAFAAAKLLGLLFIDAVPVALSRDWACAQLGQSFAGQARHRLLAGRPGADMPDKGAMICTCMNVGRNEICDAIRNGCHSVSMLGAQTGAGTNCGSCQPELSSLIEEMELEHAV